LQQLFDIRDRYLSHTAAVLSQVHQLVQNPWVEVERPQLANKQEILIGERVFGTRPGDKPR